jgi:hypothetical protein
VTIPAERRPIRAPWRERLHEVIFAPFVGEAEQLSRALRASRRKSTVSWARS